MDFVKGLGDTSGAMEIAVDGLGRWEILDDRIRLTLITIRGDMPAPAVCLVWTRQGLSRNRRHYDLLNDLLCGRIAEPELSVAAGALLLH